MNIAGDDYWLPGKMKLQFKFMENNPEIGLCFGKARIVKNGKVIGNWGIKDGETFEALIAENRVSALTVCIRKAVLDKYIELVQPEKKNWKMEDWPIALWFSKYSKLHFINRDLGVYRIISGSLGHPKKINEKLAFQDSRTEICLYFAGNDIKYVQKIQKAHELAVANIYLAHDDLEKFRNHNFASGVRGIFKNIISYFPGGVWLLKKIILK